MERSPEKKVRLAWLDAVKGLAILAVILGHVFLGFTENNAFPADQRWMRFAMNWIYAWHMPLFFCISGFAFSLSILPKDEKDRQKGKEKQKEGKNKRKFRKQVLNLLILYLVFSVLLGLLKIAFSDYVDNPLTLRDVFLGLLLPDHLMWYLWVLLAYYLVCFFLMPKNPAILLLPGLLLLIAGKFLQYNINLQFCLKNLMCCFVYFVLGICFEKHLKAYGKKAYGAAALCAAAASGAFFILGIQIPGRHAPFLGSVLEAVIALSAIWACFSLFSACYRPKRKPGFLARFGLATLVIYLVHTYFVTALKALVIRTGFGPGWLAVLLLWAVTAAASYAVFLLSRKFRIIGALFRPADLICR